MTVKNFGERYYSEIVVKDRKNPIEVRRVLDREVFPAIGNRPVHSIDAMTIQRLVFRKRDHGLEAAAVKMRNLRRTGSTLQHEQGFASDVIEKALSHTIGGVRGVYNRAEYAEQRTQMLQKWSDYVEELGA